MAVGKQKKQDVQYYSRAVARASSLQQLESIENELVSDTDLIGLHTRNRLVGQIKRKVEFIGAQARKLAEAQQ